MRLPIGPYIRSSCLGFISGIPEGNPQKRTTLEPMAKALSPEPNLFGPSELLDGLCTIGLLVFRASGFKGLGL